MICTCRTSASSMCMLTPRYSSNSLVPLKWHSRPKFQSCRSCISEVRKTQKNPRHSFGNGKLSECWPRINSPKIRTQAETLHKEEKLEFFSSCRRLFPLHACKGYSPIIHYFTRRRWSEERGMLLKAGMGNWEWAKSLSIERCLNRNISENILCT